MSAGFFKLSPSLAMDIASKPPNCGPVRHNDGIGVKDRAESHTQPFNE
ncbi:MAG: hypothetical protein WCQ20_14045 [Synechococcaceae cyanobacterium ELA739]